MSRPAAFVQPLSAPAKPWWRPTFLLSLLRNASSGCLRPAAPRVSDQRWLSASGVNPAEPSRTRVASLEPRLLKSRSSARLVFLAASSFSSPQPCPGRGPKVGDLKIAIPVNSAALLGLRSNSTACRLLHPCSPHRAAESHATLRASGHCVACPCKPICRNGANRHPMAQTPAGFSACYFELHHHVECGPFQIDAVHWADPCS